MSTPPVQLSSADDSKLSTTQETAWWTLESNQIIEQMKTDVTHGLTSQEATTRRKQYGYNELAEPEKQGLLASLIEAFQDPFAIVLTIAAVVSALIGIFSGGTDEFQQAFWIMSIVVFMTLIGWYTDQSASKQLERIKQAQKVMCSVFRDGRAITLESREIVPGDVLTLSQGDRVPTDARVISAINATVEEAILTGEAIPRPKTDKPISLDTPLADRENMLYGGTHLNSGNIRAVAVTTGMNTELGKIWERLIETEEQATPLQEQLDSFGKLLLWGAGIICTLILAIYVIVQGLDIFEGLIIASSLAIAFIPEALGAIILISLALGVQEMLEKHAIIRRLYAAEALGSISVVCTDKTGTVTFGHMTPTHVWTFDKEVSLAQVQRYQPDTTVLTRIFEVVRYCNNLTGPSESALGHLLVLTGQEITAKDIANRDYEVPFNSFRKRMSTARQRPTGGYTMYTKGASTELLPLCRYIALQSGDVEMSEAQRAQLTQQITAYENEGYRVFIAADRLVERIDGTFDESYERDFVFLGLIALSDPPRPEVIDTIGVLTKAGITPKMVTGDSPLTALSIAKAIGLVPQNATLNEVITSREIRQTVENAYARFKSSSTETTADSFRKDPTQYFTPEDLNRFSATRIFARVTPEDKVYIVQAMQRNNQLTAMVGDGVNDAAAIQTANVGIAMHTGSDLTKDVSDVVLTAGYEAIGNAVRVGRTILYRTRLYTHALLSTNGAEVGLFIVAALVGWPIPLTAVQLLVINLSGDSWLSIALATEKEEQDVMDRPPRPASEPVITRYMWMSIALQSVLVTILMALAFIIAEQYNADNNIEGEAALILQQTAVFITFMTQKILRSAFTARSLKFNLWQIGFFTNRWSLLAAVVSLVLCTAAVYLLPVGMDPVPTAILPSLFLLGVVPPLVEELIKFIRQRTVYKSA